MVIDADIAMVIDIDIDATIVIVFVIGSWSIGGPLPDLLH